MNQIGRVSGTPQSSLDVLGEIQKKDEPSVPLDLDFLANSLPPTSPSLSATVSATPVSAPAADKVDDLLNGDDAMVDLSIDEPHSPPATNPSPVAAAPPATASDVKSSLADISVSMDSLKPGELPFCLRNQLVLDYDLHSTIL